MLAVLAEEALEADGAEVVLTEGFDVLGLVDLALLPVGRLKHRACVLRIRVLRITLVQSVVAALHYVINMD